MKRKYKNRDLAEILNNVELLGNLPMTGELALAVIRARSFLKKFLEVYNSECKQIGESRCEKDKEGRSISIYQKDEAGNELLNFPKQLKFKNLAAEEEALKAVKSLGELEVEVEVFELDKSVLESINTITPIQLEAILSLVQIIETSKRN